MSTTMSYTATILPIESLFLVSVVHCVKIIIYCFLNQNLQLCKHESPYAAYVIYLWCAKNNSYLIMYIIFWNKINFFVHQLR